MRLRELFGGKTGNRGKGRPKGSRNKRTATQKALDAAALAAAGRQARLDDLRTQLEEVRLQHELDAMRQSGRRQPARTRPPKDSNEALLRLLEPFATALAPLAARIAANATGQPAPQDQAAPAATAPPAPQPHPALSAPPAEPAAATGEAPPADFVSKTIVGMIDGKAPAQVALLLANHAMPQVRETAAGLSACQDEATLVAYLEHIAPTAPYLVWWLRQPERWAWTVDTVHCLQQLPAA